MISPRRIYRFSIWLPLIVPAVMIVVYNILLKGFGMSKASGYVDIVLEMVAYSLIYGGLPYILLASWATWWIRDRSEKEIRRVMFVAPLLMIATFTAACLVMAGISQSWRVWMSVAALGASVTIPLGYAYVAITVLLRHALGPRQSVSVS